MSRRFFSLIGMVVCLPVRRGVRTVVGWIAVLLVCCCGHALSRQSPADLVPIFANGTEGYTCFRIPAIVRTPGGRLLAFAEARRDGCSDFGNVRIVMRRSRNGGKTWGPLETVAENGSLQAGNAAPVVDTMDLRYPHGRVFLVYSTGDAPESAVMQGKGTRRVWFRTSVDDGATWAAPVEITASVKLSSWRAYASGPGHALQLTEGPHAGRIVFAANHSEGPSQAGGRSYQAHTFFSDDHGSTWRLGATVAAPGSNESTAAEGPGGTVVMNSRDQSGSHARILSISRDGSGHWDSTFVAQDLPDPTCEGSMIGYEVAKDRRVLLFSNAGDRRERWNLTISVSMDGGRSWPRHTVLYAGPAAYSDIVALPQGRLGVLWERGDECGIVFLMRSVKSLL
jgi:sialidase-1